MMSIRCQCYRKLLALSIRKLKLSFQRSLLLEDADYDVPSLSMLQEIASALNQKVEIKFLGIKLATSLV